MINLGVEPERLFLINELQDAVPKLLQVVSSAHAFAFVRVDRGILRVHWHPVVRLDVFPGVLEVFFALFKPYDQKLLFFLFFNSELVKSDVSVNELRRLVNLFNCLQHLQSELFYHAIFLEKFRIVDMLLQRPR